MIVGTRVLTTEGFFFNDLQIHLFIDLCSAIKVQSNVKLRDFPGDLVTKPPHSQHGGGRASIPGQGTGSHSRKQELACHN